MTYMPGMGLALGNIAFWVKKREEPKELEVDWSKVLENVDKAEEKDNFLTDSDLLYEMSHHGGPVKQVHETLEESLHSYEGKKAHLESRIADLQEELRQTDVTIRALSAARNILATDIVIRAPIEGP